MKKNREVNAKDVYKLMYSLFRLMRRLSQNPQNQPHIKDLFDEKSLFTYTPREYKQTAN